METKDPTDGTNSENLELPNEDYIELSEDERNQLIEYNQSVRDIEKARGRRILYQEAPPETLPFIVYSIFVSANAFAAIGLMVSVTGFLWQVSILISLAMVLPLVGLPPGSLRETFSWIREVISFNRS